MGLKRSIQAVVWPIGINLAALIAASILDMVLSALLPRFSSQGLMITCFAVSGVFSGLFCYSTSLEQIEKEERGRFAARNALFTTALCTLIFFAIAPLSGWEYNIPFKAFAIAETLMVLFLWKNKFHRDT